MQVLINIQKTEKGTVVAICDKDIFGKFFEQDGLVLDIGRPFFGGVESGTKDIMPAIRSACSASVCGNRAVGFLLSEGVLKEENVRTVAGVRHAMIFRI